MPTCLICQQLPTKRDGYDRRGRQRYTCRRCRRDFTQLSGSAFSGYRWPAEVILAGSAGTSATRSPPGKSLNSWPSVGSTSPPGPS
jgi:transposase-like protein